MKASRRSFLGIMGGAAVAGPGVAQQVVAKMSGGNGIGAGTLAGGKYIGEMYNNAKDCLPASDDSWIRRRIEECVKGIAEIDAGSKPYHTHERVNIEAQRIDVLRSVAPSQKARMVVDHMRHLERIEQRGYFQNELDHLKERLGVLGQFL